jgi:hypothetical protein
MHMSLLSSKRIARGLAALVAVVALPALAMAGTVTFSAPTISLTESAGVQTGFFNVIITDSVGGVDQIQGFGAQVVSSDALVTFIAADLTTTNAVNPAPYVFVGNTGGGGFNQQTPNDEYNTDVPLNNTGPFLTVAPEALVRVEYSIPANYVGTTTLSITTDPDSPFAAFWNDAALNSDLPAIINGSITVSAPATPEPSSIVLLALGAIGLFGVRRLRARRA